MSDMGMETAETAQVVLAIKAMEHLQRSFGGKACRTCGRFRHRIRTKTSLYPTSVTPEPLVTSETMTENAFCDNCTQSVRPLNIENTGHTAGNSISSYSPS